MTPRLRPFLDLLLPTRCLGCGGAAGRGRDAPICPACTTRVRPLRGPGCLRCGTPLVDPAEPHCDFCADWPSTVTARSATAWEAPSSRLVEALKYDGWHEIAPWIGRRTARVVGPVAPGAVVVPIPSTPGRVRSRGFNPAEQVARAVAEALDRELLCALERPSEGARQVGLPADRRSANVRNAFLPAGRMAGRLGGRPVLLVDDVLTTGATALEAARILLDVGSPTVRILTFARSFPRRPGERRRAS